MAISYHKMSGISDFKIEITNVATLTEHRHPYDTLNCVWGDKGTAFPTEDGKAFGTAEGDYAYFRQNVMHEATDTGEKDRISIIFQPQNLREHLATKQDLTAE